MSVLEELEWYSNRYASVFGGSDLPIRPRRGLVILTCMDARIHPERFLGLALGDAQIIRNAGGRVTEDAIRSIGTSVQLFGTREVVVIQHTDCHMPQLSSEELRRNAGEPFWGDHQPATAQAGIINMERALRDDLQSLLNSGVIGPEIKISGAIYHVRTGRLERVGASLRRPEYSIAV